MVTQFFKTNQGIALALFLFFPWGCHLVWRKSQWNLVTKVASTFVGLLFLINLVSSYNNKFQADRLTDELTVSEIQANELGQKYKSLQSEFDQLIMTTDSQHKEAEDYQEKMKPYEKLSVADAKKKAADLKAAEEARGYEIGITYDQIARTPDDYFMDKVKFYGKVIQLIEDDDQINIRLAVNDNYDTIILGEYGSSIVTSRILEDDYITISGVSAGITSYESTMGGTISILSVLIEKIE